MTSTDSDTYEYDALPYTSATFAQTHPDHLAAIGILNGLSTAHPEKCRVLELGCGNGSNLNWLAYSLLASEFVGVDLSETHIEDAKKSAAALGLDNIEFQQQNVLEIDEQSFGKFDYIIAHGLFSWVPDFVRDRILGLCSELLNEDGIAYISYNVFPGCHRRKITSEAMRFHARGIENPLKKVESGRSFLKFISENEDLAPDYKAILEHELKGISSRSDSNIFHDDLAEENQPFYFSEFIGLSEKHDLQYLSDATQLPSQPRTFSKETLEFIEKSSENLIEYEQYVDLINGARFRQSLLCQASKNLDRKFDPAKIAEFQISSSVRPTSKKVDLASGKNEEFTSVNGSSISTDHVLTKTALVFLAQNGAHAFPFDELIESSRAILAKEGFVSNSWESEANTTASFFFQTFSPDMIHFHLSESRATRSIAEKPNASAFARMQAKKNEQITTFYGASLAIENPFVRQLLLMLDGSRNRADLIRDLQNIFGSSDEQIDEKALIKQIALDVDQTLAEFAQTGILEK